MTSAPSVFLVDDQAPVLKAMARLFASDGIPATCFGSARAFLDSGLSGQPGCLVLDLSMPDMTGLDLQRELAAQSCLLPVIFLTGHGDIDSGVQAMKSGAADFLTKPVDAERLLQAVRQAFERNAQARAGHAELDELRQRLASLTAREREVLDLVVEGLLNKQIADQLGTVEKTVKVHRARVMGKMKVRSVTALVRLADRLRG
ncbi:MAG: response regulator [Pseudomonadota bacterium]